MGRIVTPYTIHAEVLSSVVIIIGDKHSREVVKVK